MSGGFNDSVLHHLTAQLLQAQHKNARLQAENRELQHMLQLAGGSAAAASGAVQAQAAAGASVVGAPMRTVPEAPLAAPVGVGSAGLGAMDGPGVDVDTLLHQMHGLLDEQVRVFCRFFLPCWCRTTFLSWRAVLCCHRHAMPCFEKRVASVAWRIKK